MTDQNTNPYSSPRSYEANDPRFRFRWRVIPAALFFTFGALIFCFGIFAVSIAAYVIAVLQNYGRLPEMIAGCSLYLGLGASWMIAGWFYLHGKFRNALLATAVGIVIPIVVFLIMGSP
jgi:hypothetical protein